jgi:hypothetical protein
MKNPIGDKVDAMTERLRKDNFAIFSLWRFTSEGYYESVVLDPERGYVEITTQYVKRRTVYTYFDRPKKEG